MKQLKQIKKKTSGRNSAGKLVVRHKGGQHKRYLRLIDFKRDKRSVQGVVEAIEYDPNRTCDIALIHYSDGDKRYILSPVGLKKGDKISAGPDSELTAGNALPLKAIPIGTVIHNIEITPGKGGQIARGAGVGATVSAKEGNYIHLRMPSGEMRKVSTESYGTIGQVGNIDWKNEVMGKAGRNRNRGIRPTVRGVAQNPRSHAHGGGEGRSGIGMPTPRNNAGRRAVGKTRRPTKYSNKYILQRRKNK